MTDESLRLHHLTLDTGHLSTPLLTSVPEPVLAVMEGWLRESASAPSVRMPLPGYGHGYTALTTWRAGNMVQTVFTPGGDPLVTFGVAASQGSDADELWQQIIDGYGQQMPHCPWCAVMLRSTIDSDLDSLHWLGDYERCAAIAWIRIAQSLPR